MRWTTKLSCDVIVKLCQEFWCQKLLKSDNYSSTYRQQYEWMFFFETRCMHHTQCNAMRIQRSGVSLNAPSKLQQKWWTGWKHILIYCHTVSDSNCLARRYESEIKPAPSSLSAGCRDYGQSVSNCCWRAVHNSIPVVDLAGNECCDQCTSGFSGKWPLYAV